MYSTVVKQSTAAAFQKTHCSRSSISTGAASVSTTRFDPDLTHTQMGSAKLIQAPHLQLSSVLCCKNVTNGLCDGMLGLAFVLPLATLHVVYQTLADYLWCKKTSGQWIHLPTTSYHLHTQYSSCKRLMSLSIYCIVWVHVLRSCSRHSTVPPHGTTPWS